MKGKSMEDDDDLYEDYDMDEFDLLLIESDILEMIDNERNH